MKQRTVGQEGVGAKQLDRYKLNIGREDEIRLYLRETDADSHFVAARYSICIQEWIRAVRDEHMPNILGVAKYVYTLPSSPSIQSSPVRPAPAVNNACGPGQSKHC